MAFNGNECSMLACCMKNQLNVHKEKVTKGEGDHFVVMDSNLGNPSPAPEWLQNNWFWSDAQHELVECFVNSMVIFY